MSKDDKNDVKKTFKSPHFILTLGFLVTGYFLSSLGNLLTLEIMKLIWVPLRIIAGITISVDLWKEKYSITNTYPSCNIRRNFLINT